MRGTYEHPDWPMTEDRYGVKPKAHIPAAVLHQYLTDFAQRYNIYDHIQFNTKVEIVEPVSGGGWKLSVMGPKGRRTVTTAKLVLATGLTSTPNMPEYKGADNFEAPLFHAKEFCVQAPSLKNIKNTIVVGGAKSALDVAYAMVQEGSTVDLVMRENGHGPVWIAPSFVTPFKKAIDQLLLIRWMTWFSPVPWGGEDGFPGVRRFFHGTAVGRFIVDTFWKVLSGDVVGAIGYDNHPELKKLKPWHSAFWTGSGLSVVNYDSNIFDLVRQGKIRVHVSNIDHLEPKKAILTDGTVLEADLMICSTGWKKESPIKYQGIGPSGFGLNCSPGELAALNRTADKDVLAMFPRLRNQPPLKFTPKAGEPLRLYRFMVPEAYISQHTIAFAGAMSSVSTASCANAQGVWIGAYLSDKLERKPSSQLEVRQEIMLHTQWGKWRFPYGYGASLPDFVFEGVSYIDMLLRDMGLTTHRKNGLFQELTSPYMPKDYVGLVEEWKERQQATLESK